MNVRPSRLRRLLLPAALLAAGLCSAALPASAGAVGLSGYTQVTGTAFVVKGGTSGTATATCPGGDDVLSGGYIAANGLTVSQSAPTSAGALSGTTWSVTGFNTTANNITLTAYAVCASPPAGWVEQSAQYSVGAGLFAQDDATCPSGDVLSGGGFNDSNPRPNISQSMNEVSSNVVDNTWDVDDTNGTQTAETLTVYALCLGSSISGYSYSNLNQSTTAGTITATCPSGGMVLGGGETAPAPWSVGPFVNNAVTGLTLNPHNWSVTAASTGGGVIGSSALCALPLPVVSSFLPTSGPAAGGTSVTINGSGFNQATAVDFGATPATNFAINSDSSITATSPAGAGQVSVSVTATAGNTGSSDAAHQFSYVPSVTSISPTAGPVTGGTSVTINGAGFTAASTVSFGGTAASSVTFVNSGQLKAVSPADAAGTVDVQVTTSGGTSAAVAGDRFTYDPTVTSVSPSAGPVGGGTQVTINGTGFLAASGVLFGGVASSAVTYVSSTQLKASSPAGSAGTVDVQVTANGATSVAVAGDKFTYDPVPTVSGLSPSAGPLSGGTTVTITGTGFVSGASSVSFGGRPASSVSFISASQLKAISPPGSAVADVTVTTPGGTSGTVAADRFSYDAVPVVSGLSPAAGPTGGGTAVTINGSGFVSGATVAFGSSPATSVTFVSASQLKAVSPAGPAGAVDVKVTSPGGTSATGSADRFTYFSAPAVSGVSPSSGPVAGGTSVTITGSGFTFAMAVNFGTSAATSFVVNSDSQITAVSPAGAAGTVDVLVSSSAGTSAAAASDRFTYQAPVSTPQPAPGSTPAPGAPSSGAGAPPASLGSTSEVFAGVVNPQGLPTIAYFQYGLDSTYQPHVAAVSYNQQTPPQQVGSDFTNHTVTATVTGLVPHALYHYRLVSSNSAGTAFGPDATFTTAQDPPPPPPIEGKTTNLAPVAGLVLIELPHTHHFVPLTEAIQIPFGSTVNATAGTVALTAARTPNLHGPLQTADFYDGEFFVTQRRGNALTYLKLVGGLSCSKRAPEPRATAAGAPPHKLKRKLWGNGHGQFQTQGSYASASVQGTFWLTEDFCDGTLVQVRRGVVKVLAFRTKKTVLVPAGHSYFAKSR